MSSTCTECLLPYHLPRCYLAAVTAKVVQAQAGGTLGKLTIPELKAYLKSIKAPVGGKKGELEERVRQRLGGWGGGGEAVPAGTVGAGQ